MKISILIAVYNTEAYIRQCLDSLLSQTHEDWEAICVDDCSTDHSLDILKEYAEKDSRIKVIHLATNQGQAKARNKGIEYCTGDIACFLDSDDWFSHRSLAQINEVFTNNAKADCVLFNCIKMYPDGKSEEICNHSRFPLSGKEAFEKSLDWSIHGIYATRMNIQRQYPYDDTCRSFSDDNTTRLHYLASREVHSSDAIYYYRQNPNSVSHVINISRFNFLLANEHMQQMLEEMKVDKSLLAKHECVRWLNLIGCYRFFLCNRESFSREDKEYAISLMHRIWKEIDTSCIPSRIRFKPGYAKTPSWTLFQWQQSLYNKFRKFLT